MLASAHILIGCTDGLLVARVGRRLQRESLQMAATAEQPAVQRITALVRLIGQLHAALLTDVAIDVEVLVHGNDAHGLIGALNGCDACSRAY